MSTQVTAKNPRLTEVDPLAIAEVCRALRCGGVVAYPTEGVWGLGCDPFNERAVQSLLLLKNRDPGKGIILIAASIEQLGPWLTRITPEQRQQLESTWPGPHTWLIDDGGYTPALIRGQHTKVALRVTDHPWVVALCEAFGGPLVSTSANVSGQPPLQTYQAVCEAFAEAVDAVLDGPLGGLEKPTPIRDLTTGEVLRP